MPTDRNCDSEELSEFSSYFEKTYIGYFHHINKPMQFRPPFTPLLYMVKLGFSGVYIILHLLHFCYFEWSFVLNRICFSLMINIYVF